jgi:uncharacterized protein (DUF302 family)
MRNALLLLFACATSARATTSGDGLVRVRSAHDVETTADWLQPTCCRRGMTAFATIGAAQGARGARPGLRPTALVTCGNPGAGAPLIPWAPGAAIDWPPNAPVSEDDGGRVWLACNEPAGFARRHAISGCDDARETVHGALARVARAATPDQ